MNRKIAVFQVSLILLTAANIAEAQQSSPHRIGLISAASPSSMASRVEAFRQGMRGLGYVEGQHITIEYRWGEGKDERLPGFASELVRRNVGMFVTHGVLATLAAHKASATTPIVCFTCGDLTTTGLVASLARPGGSVTGMTSIHPETSGKRLELLKEIVPGLTRVAVLYNSGNPVSAPELKSTEAAARVLGLQLHAIGVKDSSEFERAVASMTRERADALVVLSDAMFHGRIKQIADLATANRMPVITPWGAEFVKVGGLVGYGPDGIAIARSAAGHVDKILKGAKSRRFAG